DLIRINGSHRQVVIGVAAVIEVKSSEHVFGKQPRNDLLNILRVVVMSRIHQDFGPWASCPREEKSHSPVAATQRFAQYSARRSDVPYPPRLWPVGQLPARGEEPFPSRRCPCDKRPARRVCIQPAFAGQETTLDALPLALVQ